MHRGRRENKTSDLCDAINNVAEAIREQSTITSRENAAKIIFENGIGDPIRNGGRK